MNRMPSLSRTEAADRAALLTVDSYDVDLDLTTGDAEFASTTVLRFRCARPGAGTFVEVSPVALAEVTLNGRAVDPAGLTDGRLPLTDLAADNELTVRASMAYSNSGEGLHRFVDPADDRTYLYAQAFLDAAQRVYACFDQADLKAKVTLRVTAPPDWTVLSNGAGESDGAGHWTFATTPPISTYMVTLCAGPYHSRYSEHDGIPLGVHCRASLAEHLDRQADELFEVTAQCFDRFHELFELRYPFGKYDQVFVPEFNAGAMENPACVTFRDEMLFRSAVTDAQRMLRAEVIAHEMAHMWFGDLVTLRWWDDIWLSESFAEYLGMRVTSEATRFTDTWSGFAVVRKVWGYAADQRPSTHPVAPVGVENSADALLNFDGISYAKGASVLRQLAALLGDEAFFAGLRRYFQAHAFGNASLTDLLAALGAASRRDLTDWAQVWLRESGVTTLRAVAATDPDGRYTRVTLVQTAPHHHPVLRPHRLAVARYGRTPDGGIVRQDGVEVDIDPAVDGGEVTVPALTGQEAAPLLLVNDGDLTYAKIRLDDAVMARLPDLLPAVSDPLTRSLLWSAAWDATRDAEIPATSFLELVVAGLPTETDMMAFAQVVHLAVDVAVRQYLRPEQQAGATAALSHACRKVLDDAAPGSDRQLSAGRGLADCAGVDDIDTLRGWLDGSAVPEGLPVDAELRWAVLRRLTALGAADSGEIEAERRRDPSAHGAEHAAWCRAARPDPAAKAAAWEALVADDSLSNRQALALAAGFWQPGQAQLTGPYVERYFADMPELASRRSAQVVASLASAAYPRLVVGTGTAEAADRMLERDGLPAALRRTVLDCTDDLRRAVAARSVAGG
jgi:aminopeptidase N